MADRLHVIDWHIHPFKADRWYAAWVPAVERSLAFGARSYQLTRSLDDPLHFRQMTIWEDPEDFERYWASDEVATIREQILNFYNKPLDQSWHTVLAAETPAAEAAARS